MVKFRPFQDLTKEELFMILSWRNDVTVREWMNIKEPIQLEVHLQFVEDLRTNEKRACYLVSEFSKDIGVIQLNDIHENVVNDVGMYLNPILIKSGVGIRLGFYGAQFLFKTKGYKRLMFTANINNTYALNLWKVLGIERISGQNGNQVYGQLNKDDFLAKPQDFKAFIRSV